MRERERDRERMEVVCRGVGHPLYGIESGTMGHPADKCKNLVIKPSFHAQLWT